MIFLETPRLLFRPHQADDEEDFVQMQTDSEVRRYIGGKAWPREKAVYRFRNGYLGKPSKIYGLWATVLKSESKYIGYCGLHRVEESVRLGYYISRPYWRRGLATEASQALLDVAFSQLQLSKVFADVEKGNEASDHIPHKLGFALIGQEELPRRILQIYRLSNPRSLIKSSIAYLILDLDRRPCLRTLFGRSPLHFVRDRDERSTNASNDSIRVGVFHKTIPDRLPTQAHSFDTFGLPKNAP